MKHFIFGYGSLICPQSRAITAPNLTSYAEPVVILNLERAWSARMTKETPHSETNREHIEGRTLMGVRFRTGARCNGVLICVDEEELKRFDVREAGYERHRIDVGDIIPHVETDALIDEQLPLWPITDINGEGDFQSLALERVQCKDCRIVIERGFARRRQRSARCNKESIGLPSPMISLNDESNISDVSVWVYIQSEDLPANRNYPITQSYIDIILRGCLSISHDFAHRFLETTDGWWHDGKSSESNDTHAKVHDHHTWVNDRHAPMYVRADSDYSIENGEVIDKLIAEHHPDALKRRVMSI